MASVAPAACTRVGWVLVFERMLEARCALGTWSGCARWRPIARAGGDVRGERARPEFRIEGAKAGVQGMRVRVRARARAVAGVGGGELGAN